MKWQWVMRIYQMSYNAQCHRHGTRLRADFRLGVFRPDEEELKHLFDLQEGE